MRPTVASDSVMAGGPGPLAEGAWLLPFATLPLALALVFGSTGLSPLEVLQEAGIWIGAVGAAGLLSSLFAARVLAAAAHGHGPAPALAIVPFVFPHTIALLGTRACLGEIFVARTYCGPATREQVITSSLSGMFLLRVFPLFISCAGVLLIALATVFISRRLSRRARWGTIGATSALAWSLAVAALSVAFIRVNLVGMLDVTPDPMGAWLRQIVEQYRDYLVASNTLLVAAVAFAAAAMSRKDSLTGVVTLGAVIVGAVGIRATVALDEAQLRWQFEEFPLYESVRSFDEEEWSTTGVQLGTWKPAVENVKDSIRSSSALQDYWAPDYAALVKRSQARGVPVPWPFGISATSDVSTPEFRRALRTVRAEGVSDVIFNSPIAPFDSAPSGLRPLVEYQNSFDWSDAVSLRFLDETACEPTTLSERPRVRTRGIESVWKLPCEITALEAVTADNLHGLASAALSRGNRLVIQLARNDVRR